jgi:glycosyltransferase involved in cell wall biosynthesis
MAEAWGRIAARYPAVRFVVVGHLSPLIVQAVPAAQLVTVPWLPVDVYPRAYRGIDILCCPLADTDFNRGKSPIKAFEGAAAGCAVVASPTVYRRVLHDGGNGYIVRDAEAWAGILAALLDYPELRQRVAVNWQRRVQQRHNLDADASMWPRAWGKLIGAARVGVGVG